MNFLAADFSNLPIEISFFTFDSIIVKRASRTISANELKGDIINALNKRGITRDYDVQIRNKEFLSYVPINSNYQVDIKSFNFDEKIRKVSTNFFSECIIIWYCYFFTRPL